MNADTTFQRFLDAQKGDYNRALTEIKNGRKQSHWMWYIFPQIQGLGFSEMAKLYALSDLHEAADYLAHPLLGSRLITITKALLANEGKTALQILGTPDELKLRSSMTLFSSLPDTDPVFQAVLDKFFAGKADQRTLDLIKSEA